MGGLAAVLLALAASAALLQCTGAAAATGTTPIAYPNAAGGLAQSTAALVPTNSSHFNAYSERLNFSYTIAPVISAVGCLVPLVTAASCNALMNATQNVSGMPAGGTTWINASAAWLPPGGCGQYSTCQVTYSCGSLSVLESYPPASVKMASSCPNLRVNWTYYGSAPGHLLGLGFVSPTAANLTLTVTRAAVLNVTQNSSWFWFGSARENLRANITFAGPSRFPGTTVVYNNSATNCAGTSTSWGGTGHRGWCPTARSAGAPTSVSPLTSAWWLPYPTGSWSSTGTQVTELDTNATLPAANFTMTQKALLLEWTGFPTVAASITQHYLFSLLSLSPENTTGQPPGEIVLVLGNVTQGAFYTASATWQNAGSANFTGTFYLEGSWLADATSVSVYANGAAIPAYETSVSGTAIVVYAGFVPVAAQGTVTFVVHYEPAPAWSFTAAAIYIAGYGLSSGTFILMGGLGAGLAVVWWKARNPGGSTLLKGIAGVAVFSIAWFAVVAF